MACSSAKAAGPGLAPQKAVLQGRHIEIRGTVQGVGFRPWVYRVALQVGVGGRVLNDAAGVVIEAFGTGALLDRFIAELQRDRPPAAEVRSFAVREIAPRPVREFTIAASAVSAERRVSRPADLARCPDCEREIFDPANRRYRYPFTNCTNCGPRFTIARDVPYDRPATTMSPFVMCKECRREYESVDDRRFHAQPNACPVCGPRLFVRESNPLSPALTGTANSAAPEVSSRAGARDPANGWRAVFEESRAARPPRSLAPARDDTLANSSPASAVVPGRGEQDAIAFAAAALKAGQIVAIKGIGGFHLACDATSADAIATLRARKKRDEKPFAIMVRDLAAAESLAILDDAERALLTRVERPIVLVRNRARARLSGLVAPHNRLVGILLPYSPLHHLLLADTDLPLVMTSGNLSEEPIAYRNDEAVERLRGIADLFLLHDRDIVTRCDDSVARVIAGAPAILRRSRGYVPRALPLGRTIAEPILACGAHLKNTFAIAHDDVVHLGPHIGDLENVETLDSFEESIERMQRFLGVKPEVVAHDMHPTYVSTE